VGRHLAHHAQRAVDQVGSHLSRSVRQDFWNHRFKERLSATFENIICSLQACTRLWTIRSGFGVAQSQRSHTIAMISPELEQRVTANRDTNKWSTADLGVVHNAGDISSMFLHC